MEAAYGPLVWQKHKFDTKLILFFGRKLNIFCHMQISRIFTYCPFIFDQDSIISKKDAELDQGTCSSYWVSKSWCHFANVSSAAASIRIDHVRVCWACLHATPSNNHMIHPGPWLNTTEESRQASMRPIMDLTIVENRPWSLQSLDADYDKAFCMDPCRVLLHAASSEHPPPGGGRISPAAHIWVLFHTFIPASRPFVLIFRGFQM